MIEVKGPMTSEFNQILTPEALRFLGDLQKKFNPTRLELLKARDARQKDLDAGKKPEFLEETRFMRTQSWKVTEVPADLQDRRVEITGPVEPKMMINALNSGAKVFMGDFEDSCSPTWTNVMNGQLACQKAVRRTLSFTSPEGKAYKLGEKLATLVIRPRGWHLLEENVLDGGEPMSASLFDFGLYLFHNAQELIKRGSGPYFYLPKLESHLEARLWNDVFVYAQEVLGLPKQTIKCTVLIETILAAFEMEEILFELKDHIVALNAGRWDYLFSAIKKFRAHKEVVFPDRAQLTMTVPFMRAYTELLVQTCHKRGAHAIGGMAAFIPSRKDAEVNRVALGKVREDKERESRDGFDGTWVAHPDLVPVATEIFDQVLGSRPHQKDKLKSDVKIEASQLIDFRIPGGKITEAGVRNNISVALQYIESWLGGVGAVGIFNLMEDAATAEISRGELWQWVNRGAKLDDGRPLTAALYKDLRADELAKLGGLDKGRMRETVEIFDGLVLNEKFDSFLTLPAYRYLKNV